MARKYTSLTRYSQWDGTQKVDLEADDILSAISEDLMEFGDLQQALRYLMQRGMDTSDGNYIRGLRDMLRQLKDQRRQRLERFDMNSVMEDITRQLEEILDMERETIEEWMNQDEAEDQSRQFMDDLMKDLDNLDKDRQGEAGNDTASQDADSQNAGSQEQDGADGEGAEQSGQGGQQQDSDGDGNFS
ncbi:MAG: hypothetical protein HUJ31_00215, partial [Pseudomonadales bacterium]|nr:hypothetical protein [Pseudomonadales bacterium]